LAKKGADNVRSMLVLCKGGCSRLVPKKKGEK